jgi:hypothetical protein
MTTRVIASFLFETPPFHVTTFVMVAVTMAVAAGLAAWIPARRRRWPGGDRHLAEIQGP